MCSVISKQKGKKINPRLFGIFTGIFCTIVENSRDKKISKKSKKALAFFKKTYYTEISGKSSQKPTNKQAH
jgi:hypothetical protein